MKAKKKLRSVTAVSWLLVLSIMGTWLVSMVLLTVVTAQEIYDTLYEIGVGYAESISKYGLLDTFYDNDFSRYGYQYERPDFLEHQILSTIERYSSTSYHTGGNYDSWDQVTGKERRKLIRSISYPMEAAVLVYSPEGDLLHSSKNDSMYFGYYTQEEWDAGADSSAVLHYGWIDISEEKNAEDWKDDPYLRFRTTYAGIHSLWSIPALRVTGYWEGTQLNPVIMHYISDGDIQAVLEQTDQFSTGPTSYRYTISEVDRTGLLNWQLQFDHSEEYEGADLVTVYIEHPDMWSYEENPLTYKGKEYESLAHLTEELDFPQTDSVHFSRYSLFGLTELLVFSKWTGGDFSNETYLKNGEYTVDFHLITAVRSNPLLCAVSALRNIYIVTGLSALILLLLVRGSVKNRLVRPVAAVANAMEDNWRSIYRSENAPSLWREADKLLSGYTSEQDRRRIKDNEITRLNTALNYAKTAEQNRRQMTSNIAHELKTPLAVIHSYAEGLKEHIAEEKRDQYIDVILSEAERTDTMVLEMLDLSRLEAGKIKLARNEFDLTALTHAVFEKLEFAILAKNLQLAFALPESCPVTADESRISQVIENFATNAVKYTPPGGHITVRIQSLRSQTLFSIENSSPPLSEETLGKVWDTFYRADESRSTGGTGLGLAIAKNIVELHGGSCSARNTTAGVDFGFTLP